MAHRQALTDLQQRLAQRMAQAREQPMAAGWLAVRVDGHGVLLPLAQAGEIFKSSQVLQVPYTRPWMLGVVNLRGSLCTAIDLGLLLHQLGVPWVQAPHSAELGSGLQLVSINPVLQVNAALRIDALAGLRNAPDFVAQQPPVADAPAFFGVQLQDVQAECWQVLDVQQLVHSPAFLGVGV
ncbi:MAG: hypothetical protein Fur007_00070 [Rhodoferax sp.]